jgi:hypothetical protein
MCAVVTARFAPQRCAKGLQVSDGGLICTRVKPTSGAVDTHALLNMPPHDGACTLTFQCLATGHFNAVHFGFAQATLDLTDADAFESSGSFVDSCFGSLYGLGEHHSNLPNPYNYRPLFKKDETLTITYRPGPAGYMAGTLHAHRNDMKPQLIFSGLADDLVPAVLFADQGASWRLVDSA